MSRRLLLTSLLVAGCFLFGWPPGIQEAGAAIDWGTCRTDGGTTTIPASSNSSNITLSPAITDTSKAFLLVDSSGTSGVVAGDAHMVSGYIANSTTLTFQRGGSPATDAQVSYSLVECFNNEFSVQQGEITIAASATSNTATITSVDLTKSIVIVNSRTADTNWAEDEALVTGELQDAATVLVERAVAGTYATYVRYEVVTFSAESSVSVQTGEVTLVSGNASVTDTITPVTTGLSWLYASWDASDNGLKQTAIGCELTNSTTVTFYRYNVGTGHTNRIRYYVVEFPSGSNVSVQRGSVFNDPGSLDDTQYNHDITITAVSSITKAFPFVTNTTDGAGTAFPRNKWIESLLDTTTLRTSFWRGADTGAADNNYKYWQVVEFPALTATWAQTTKDDFDSGTKTNVVTPRLMVGESIYGDLRLGPTDNTSLTWSAQSSWNSPAPGSYGLPALADLDDDGDYDLLLGETDGICYGYRNTGTRSSPVWSAETSWNTPNVGGGGDAAPAFADLDNDGDLDLMIGEEDGNINAYENTGGPSGPVWTVKTAWEIGVIGSYSNPDFADLDCNGDYDLMIGLGDGTTKGYENTGDANSPIWSANTSWDIGDVGSYATPALADLDGDGDYDILIGEQTGNSNAYKNTGTSSAPAWTDYNNWDVSDIGSYSVPRFCNLDDTRDEDLLIGLDDGIAYGYANSDAGSTASGEYISSAYDTGSGSTTWGDISWTEYDSGSGGDVTFYTRTATTEAGLSSASWSSGYGSSPSAITSPANQWIQYKIDFTTTTAASTVVVTEVNIEYDTNITATTSVTTTATTITVTAKEFELEFNEDAGGLIKKWYDLKTDPGKTENLAADKKTERRFLYHGFYNGSLYISNAADTTDAELVLLEYTPTRVKVQVNGHMQEMSGSTHYSGLNNDSYYTIYPTGKIFNKFIFTNNTGSDFNYSASAWSHWLVLAADYNSDWIKGSESGDNLTDSTGYPAYAADDFVIVHSDNRRRADAMLSFYQDWTTSNGYDSLADEVRVTYSPEGNSDDDVIGWTENDNGTYTNGQSDTWNMYVQLGTSGSRDLPDLNSNTAAAPYSNDFRTPDTLTFSEGSEWPEDGDGFNEAEGAYTMDMSQNLLTFDIDGNYTRYNPIFKIRGYRDVDDSDIYVTLEGSSLTDGTNYNADLIPFSDADFYDSSVPGYDQLAAGGNTADSNEYLADTSNNYTLDFTTGDYLYLGSHSKFSGINIELATNAIGDAVIQWQYYHSTNGWTDFAPDSSADINNFKASGSVYWDTSFDSTWGKTTVNSGPSLYYVRAYLASGSYSTYPVEQRIRTDILILQYVGNITLSGQTFSFASPTIVDLVSFDAAGYDDRIILTWETMSEMSNAGFNLYRSEDPEGNFVRINETMIIGEGDSVIGATYSFTDYGVIEDITYYYILEDVEYDGSAEQHDPVSASVVPGLTPPEETIDDTSDNTADDPETRGDDQEGEDTSDGIDSTTGQGQQTGVTILKSDENGFIIELITNSFEIEEKVVNSVIYNAITIPDYNHGQTSEAGMPQLPVKGMLIDLPEGMGSIDLSVLEYENVLYSGIQVYPVEGGYTAAPASDNPLCFISANDINRLKGVKEPIHEFIINTAVYSSDELYPDNIVDADQGGGLRSQGKARIIFYPVRYSPARQEVVFYKRIRVRVTFISGESISGNEGQDETIITYPAFKIGINEDGIYKLSRSALENAGMDVSNVDPRTIKLFNKGREVAIYINGEADARFDTSDYIEFYGTAYKTRYTSTNIYWLTSGGNRGKRMPEKISRTDGTVSASFLSYVYYEEDDMYWGDVMDEGYVDDHWFFSNFLWAPENADFTISLNQVSDTDGNAVVRVALRGVTFSLDMEDHHTLIYLNNYLIDEAWWDDQSEYFCEVTVPQSYLLEGDNTVSVKLPGDTGADFEIVLVNWIDISYWKDFTANSDRLMFQYSEEGNQAFKISPFSSDKIEVFDITKEDEVIRITGTAIESSGSVYTAIFGDSVDTGGNEYIVSTTDSIGSPLWIAEDTESLLRSGSKGADYIIITHKDFYDEILPLLDYRRLQGLRGEIIDVEDIYDEFSNGILTPQAIKDFLSYTYTHWVSPVPAYVLLVGDGTYDYQDNTGLGLKNYVPAYLSHSMEFGETANDNWFVCLDGEDDILPDMRIGRIPAKTPSEVSTVVGKILGYELSSGDADWAKKSLFIADNEERIFETISDDLASYLPSDYSAEKVYLGSYAGASDAKADIIARLNQGALITHYAGHGAVQSWAHENIFGINDIGSLTNSDMLSFFINTTCANGYFIYPAGFNSFAEELLFADSKGAIAVIASTGISLPERQRIFVKGIFNAIFNDGEITIGSAMVKGKTELFANEGINGKNIIQTFTLFGDPATRIRGR
ncbi:MAG: C25 family cysteine peptidase [Nitrospinota bacterium]